VSLQRIKSVYFDALYKFVLPTYFLSYRSVVFWSREWSHWSLETMVLVSRPKIADFVFVSHFWFWQSVADLDAVHPVLVLNLGLYRNF